MKEEKSNIQKLEEQIQNIQDEEKRIGEKKEEDGHVIYVDRDIEFSEEMGDTKKVEKVEDIEKVDDIEKVEEKEEVTVPKEEDSLPTKEEPLEKDRPKKKKRKIIIGILILILILFLIILTIFLNKRKTEEIDKKNTLSSKEQKEILENYGQLVENALAIYQEKKDILLDYEEVIKLINFEYDINCKEHEINEDGTIYLNNCTIDKVKTKYSYGKKLEKIDVVSSDDDIKVYVSKTNGQATFNEPRNIEDYEEYSIQIDGEYFGLQFFNSAKSDYVLYSTGSSNTNIVVHMINFKTGKKVLESIDYSGILPIEYKGEKDLQYIAVKSSTTKEDSWGIYDYINNKQILGFNYSVEPLKEYANHAISGEYINAIDNNLILLKQSNNGDKVSYGLFNYKKGNEILPVEFASIKQSDQYLWAVDHSNMGHIYSAYGSELLKNKYDRIYSFVKGNYALVKDKQNIKIVNLVGKELYNYGEYEINMPNYEILIEDNITWQFTNLMVENNPDYDEKNSCLIFSYNFKLSSAYVGPTKCGIIYY